MARSFTYVTNQPSGVAVAGAKCFIGTQAANPANDTFIEIGRHISIPSFGPKAQSITLDLVGYGDQVTLKGINVLGSGDLECAYDATDAGQLAMANAQAIRTGSWNFLIIYPDEGSPGGTGTYIDVKIMVLGDTHGLGTGNNAIKRIFSLAYNSKPVITLPTST